MSMGMNGYTSLYELCEGVGWRAGFYIEAEDGRVIASRGADKPYSSASVIKLNILWSIYAGARDKRLGLKDSLTVNESDFVGGSGALKLLEPGHSLTIRELCVMMICFSDNIATNMLIDLIGMERINADIDACGLANTVLRRRMMDMDARARGAENFTSPQDAVTLLKLIRSSYDGTGDGFAADMLRILEDQACCRYLPHYMPEDVRFAHKSGGLTDVLNDAGILTMPDGRSYYAAVMTEGFALKEDGLRFINNLGAELYKLLTLEK